MSEEKSVEVASNSPVDTEYGTVDMTSDARQLASLGHKEELGMSLLMTLYYV